MPKSPILLPYCRTSLYVTTHRIWLHYFVLCVCITHHRPYTWFCTKNRISRIATGQSQEGLITNLLSFLLVFRLSSTSWSPSPLRHNRNPLSFLVSFHLFRYNFHHGSDHMCHYAPQTSPFANQRERVLVHVFAIDDDVSSSTQEANQT